MIFLLSAAEHEVDTERGEHAQPPRLLPLGHQEHGRARADVMVAGAVVTAAQAAAQHPAAGSCKLRVQG